MSASRHRRGATDRCGRTLRDHLPEDARTLHRGRRRRVTQHAHLTHRRHSPVTHLGQKSSQWCPVPARQARRSARLPVKYVAIQTFPCGRHGRRHPRPHGHQVTSRPSRSRRRQPPIASTLPPCPLTKTSRRAQPQAERPYSTSSRRASVPIDTVPAKPSCSPRGSVGDRGCEQIPIMIRPVEVLGGGAGHRGGDAGVGVQRQVRAVLLGRTHRDQDRGRGVAKLTRCRVAQLAPKSHAVMVGRIHLPCANCSRRRRISFALGSA